MVFKVFFLKFHINKLKVNESELSRKYLTKCVSRMHYLKVMYFSEGRITSIAIVLTNSNFGILLITKFNIKFKLLHWLNWGLQHAMWFICTALQNLFKNICKLEVLAVIPFPCCQMLIFLRRFNFRAWVCFPSFFFFPLSYFSWFRSSFFLASCHSKLCLRSNINLAMFLTFTSISCTLIYEPPVM